MHGGDRDDAVQPRMVSYRIQHDQLMAQVQGRRRFVQQQHPRFAEQRLGQEDELPLPAAQGIQRSVLQIIDPESAQQARRLHRQGFRDGQSERGQAAEQDHFQHGQRG